MNVRGGGGYTYMIGLSKKERFTEEAGVLMLTEALKTSYAEAAFGIRFTIEAENKSFLSRLVYVYESKQESSTCKFKKELVNMRGYLGTFLRTEKQKPHRASYYPVPFWHKG